jgi:peroxiredoxin
MKTIFFLALTLFSLNIMAQNTAPVANYAIIKGHIKNNKDNLWDYSQQGILSFATLSVPVDKNGNFFKRINIEGDAMDVLIRPGERFIFLKKNDTLTINWDANDVLHTFAITSVNKNRNRTLQNLALINKEYMEAYGKLQDSLYNGKLTDSAKFSAINQHYNNEIEILIKDGVYEDSEKLATDIYFKYTQVLLRLKLLPRFELFIKRPTNNSHFIAVVTQKEAYTRESEEWFRLSSEYRDFLFNYIRFFSPIKSTLTIGSVGVEKKMVPSYRNAAWKGYNMGLNAFNITEVRDWFCTKCIMDSFTYYSFGESVELYNDFISKVKMPYYADTLKQFYKNVQRLKPGVPAPGFTLKDENGRMVSLAKFKGKTVYIDFWGVGCGPCIYDIKNSVPQLHEKYKNKDIVFLNVCVDSDENTWKTSIKDLNVQGINLIATGWTKNPMVKAYNVQGIPHYFLIDANGKILDNNSPRPSEKKALYTKLDEALKKQLP